MYYYTVSKIPSEYKTIKTAGYTILHKICSLRNWNNMKQHGPGLSLYCT